MSYALKDYYFTQSFTERLADVMQQVYPDFDGERFVSLVHDDAWANRELKARMRHLSHCLHATLPADYPQTLALLLQAAPAFRGLQAMVFCDYVEVYGLERWELSPAEREVAMLRGLARQILWAARPAERPAAADDAE